MSIKIGKNTNKRAYSCVIDNTYMNILIIRERASGKYGIPKGKIKENETGYDAAHRELLEETGLSSCDWKTYGNNCKFIYISPKSKDDMFIGKSNEVVDTIWLRIDELKKLYKEKPEIFNKSIKIILPMINNLNIGKLAK